MKQTGIDTRAAKRRITQERASDPSFAAYLQSIENYPLLDRARESQLGRELRAGSPSPIGASGPITRSAHAARDELVTANLRLVLVIAACYAEQGVPLIDVVGVGNIGLLRAADKFQPGRARFSTHATWWIREACSRYVMNTGPMIHLPRGVIERKRKIHRVTASALADNGVTLDVDETATRVALTPKQVERALAAQEHIASLEAVIATTDSGVAVTLADTIADERAEPMDARLTRDEAADDLYKKLATVLTSRERIVLGLRFGLGELNGVVAEYRAIGKTIGVTESRVRRIEADALDKLRNAYAQDELPHAFQQLALFVAS